MALSETAIANSALILLGEPTIMDLNEGSTAANIIQIQFPFVRDALIEDHFWGFAIDRRILTKDATDPDFGPNFRYAVPVDYIKALSISENFHLKDLQYASRLPFTDESGFLLTDFDKVFLTYIKKVTDTSKFSPQFDKAFAAQLAQDIAFSLTGSNSNVDVMAALAKTALKKARANDARRHGVERPLSDLEAVRPM